MLKLMNLDPNELIEKNVFPKAAFFRGDEAEEFFEYIKSNNVEKVVQMIEADTFIIYEHDHMD